MQKAKKTSKMQTWMKMAMRKTRAFTVSARNDRTER
jgi:hypothetical protein